MLVPMHKHLNVYISCQFIQFCFCTVALPANLGEIKTDYPLAHATNSLLAYQCTEAHSPSIVQYAGTFYCLLPAVCSLHHRCRSLQSCKLYWDCFGHLWEYQDHRSQQLKYQTMNRNVHRAFPVTPGWINCMAWHHVLIKQNILYIDIAIQNNNVIMCSIYFRAILSILAQ